MNDLPNPFDCARRMDGISVELKPEDVMSLLPAMAHEEACRLLRDHGAHIAAHMIAMGIEVAYRIYSERGQNRHVK